MINLDQIEIEKFDPEGINHQLVTFVKDVREAVAHFGAIPLDPFPTRLNKVVFLGMGGSGIANELLKSLLFDTKISVEVVHDYLLPGFVDENTLVIASSYSGTTEEVLIGTKRALELQARVIAICAGGELETIAKEQDLPLFTFTYPSQPRMALSYLFSALCVIFEKLGYWQFSDRIEPVLAETEEIIKKFYLGVPQGENIAKQIAVAMQGRFPVIYTTHITHPLGLRFKAQINENAKSFAMVEQLPELNHNSIEGYLYPQLPKYVLFFESKYDYERVKLRQRITAELLAQHEIPHSRVALYDGVNPLAEYFVFISFCDHLSFYLAMLNEVNPTAIPNIKYLKGKL